MNGRDSIKNQEKRRPDNGSIQGGNRSYSPTHKRKLEMEEEKNQNDSYQLNQANMHNSFKSNYDEDGFPLNGSMIANNSFKAGRSG